MFPVYEKVESGLIPLSEDLNSATRGIIENGEVTGQETVENDALSEIPPFEGRVSFSYKFLNGDLIPRISGRFVSKQAHVSEAFYENESPGFITAGFVFIYSFNKYLSVSGGVNNIFDKAYYEHLNRNIIGSTIPLYEPGRVWYLNLRFKV